MRPEAEQLIGQARYDLENAAKNIRVQAYEVAAFLCQQAVEKFLKALWIEKKRSAPPNTHNIRKLGEELGAPQNLLPRLANLNVDYTVSRYPDAANGIPHDMYDEPTARAKLESAQEIVSWIKSQTRS